MKTVTFVLLALFILVPTVSALTWTGGPGATAATDYDIYFNTSAFTNVSFNLSESDQDQIHYYFIPGIKIIFGGIFT